MLKKYTLILCLILGLLRLTEAPAFGLVTVSNTNDSGAGSLRQALADAASGETIDFSVTGTITLTSGELTIGQNQTITGPGAGSLTIDGNDNSRIFYINSSGATVNISGLTLTNGNSANYGGGIENEGTLNISDCVISGCDANGFGNGFGGAIDNYGGTVNITSCTISGNTAVSEGGGIRNENGALTITECTISGNTTDSGGGIASRVNGSVDVIRSTIYNNSATTGGSNFGGGILCDTGTLNVTNSTISGNNAVSGGGGIIDGGAATITITQCTITGNNSTNGGGGIELGSSTANIKNTILAGNTGGNGNNYYSTGGTLNSQGYNLEDATEAGFTGTGDQQNASANMAALADNGGPTQTHALQAGSNAIDAIPEGGTGYNGAPTTDQRGFDRTGANRDVGAFEYQGKPYISGNAGVGGATLSYNDGGPQTATADGSGNYSFFVSYNWSGTVTPSQTGYAFSPTSRSYTNVILQQTNQDYIAVVGNTISGTVTDGTNPLQGVTITFSHDGHTETTAADGTYSYTVPSGTTTTITPGHPGYSGWTPANRTINNISTDQPNQDFQGTINFYAISGTVTDGTNPIQGVTITFSHDGHTETTAADGTYSYAVPYGTSTTITPSHPGYSGWTPANRTINNISANYPNQDFQGTINTYTISGTVTDGANPIQGVTITFSHDGHTETTAADGTYSYTVPYGTTTTITPSHPGYGGWTPANRTINNISANQPNQDFQGTINNYTISGTVTDGTNPIQGVTITFSHDGHSETTAADGTYSYTVPYGTTTTITPSHPGYSGWTPANRTINNISANQPNQDFQGTINNYTISGTVTDGANPIAGVTITFSHDGHTETTAADGTYSYTVPYGTTTTITPSHAGYGGWTPPNRTINNISSNQPNQDFQGTINTYTISGTVTDGANPIAGVTITFSHDAHTETTAADGTYSYAVPYGTSTTITPSHPGYSGWTPPNRTINNISSNQPNQDFQGTPYTYVISGTVTDGANPIQGVTITFSHDGHSETTAVNGTYSYTVPYGTTTTITPSHAGYSGWIPPNRTINNISSNQPNQDFQGATISNRYRIAGTVTTGSQAERSAASMTTSAPLAGVTITFSHNGHKETTDVNGYYSYSVKEGTTTTITPSKEGYSFTPSSYTIANISVDIPNRDFTASLPYISVVITNPEDGANVSGVVTIKASAKSDVGIKNVEFYVDGDKIGDGSRTQADHHALKFDLTGADTLFIDSQNRLRKNDNVGNTAPVVNRDIEISYIQAGPGDYIYVLFKTPQKLADGNYYILGKVNPRDGSLAGIDPKISSLFTAFNTSTALQFDGAGNLYYFAAHSSANFSLKKYVNKANSTILFNNEDIEIEEWLVRTDGTVLLAGRTPFTGGRWLKSMAPDKTLTHLIDLFTAIEWIADSADGLTYAGTAAEVYRIPGQQAVEINPGQVPLDVREHLRQTQANTPGMEISLEFHVLPGTGDIYSIDWDTSLYDFGLHTIEAIAHDNIDQTGEDSISVNIPEIILTLTASKETERAWIISRLYGKLEIQVENLSNVPAAKYVIYRKVADGEYQAINTFTDAELENGTYIYYDKYLDKDKTYTYKVAATDAKDAVIAVSGEVTI